MSYVKLPTFSDNGESLDIANFVYDPTKKRWEHRLRVSVDAIKRYTRAVVTEQNLDSVGTPILNEKGFVPEERMENEAPIEEDEVEIRVAATAERTGKRGRQSKYPYRTMQIGESFLVDADSVGVTFNNSLLGDRAFEIRVVNGRFRVTRTA